MQTRLSLSICLSVCAFYSAYQFLYLADLCFNLNFICPLYIHKEVNEQKKERIHFFYWTSKMIKPPPCWSHEGMKLLDIFLFSSRGAPSPISSTAFCSEKISGSDLAQIWSVRQRWPTVRGRRTPLDYPEKVQNSLSVSRGRSSCTFLTYLMASLYRERPTPSSQTCRVFALVSQHSFTEFLRLTAGGAQAGDNVFGWGRLKVWLPTARWR